jgi:hypothetical protein
MNTSLWRKKTPECSNGAGDEYPFRSLLTNNPYRAFQGLLSFVAVGALPGVSFAMLPSLLDLQHDTGFLQYYEGSRRNPRS